MKTLRHALFAGSLGLLSFVGCSHPSTRTAETTPSPGLQTPANATTAPAQTTGTIHEPIAAPVNDPTITTTPTNSGLGETPNPLTQPQPVGGPARTDDAKTTDQNATPENTTSPTDDSHQDSDLNRTPAGDPMNGGRDAGTAPPKNQPPPKTPASDVGTGSDAGGSTKPKM
jgi:hypothetical protein